MERVTIVLATYNERDNVEPLLEQLMALPLAAGVVLVNDRSPDGTADLVRAAQARHPGRVELIERAGKLGYGSAFIDGLRRALEMGADVVVTMDADFSHDPRSVPALVEGLKQHDVMIGSRYVGGIRILNWSLRRLLLSKGANFYINGILRFGVADCTSGFRAYRAAVLRAIDTGRATARGYAFLVELLEMVYRMQFSIGEAPIVYTERKQGRSKMSRGVILEAVARPWVLLARRVLGRS